MPDIQHIGEKIRDYQQRGLRLFASSSFQSHSIPMLHVLSRIDRSIPVYFLDTGYHFPETLQYRDQIAELLGLEVRNVRSSVSRLQQVGSNGRLLFASDPDHCCYLNKVQPMEPVLAAHDVWINGIRAEQNANRKQMGEEQPGPQDTLRYHPMLHWTNRDITLYMREHNLPRHPLEAKGYISIGCEPCTRKVDLEALTDERQSRWFGMNKTECGLHTDLAKK